MPHITDPLGQMKFFILHGMTWMSLICDLFVISYFVRYWRKELIQTPHNHCVVCLLLLSFCQKVMEVPLLLFFFRWDISLRQSYTFCIFWNWLDYVLITGPLHILATFCIERYLFAFHSQTMRKKGSLILFHYLPLCLCLLYAPCFYSIVIISPSRCINTWDYNSVLCGRPCYRYVPYLNVFDAIFHYGSPTIIVLVTNLFLFARIIWQKVERHNMFIWRRHRWMIVQLVLISILNVFFIFPGVIINLIRTISPSIKLTGSTIDFAFYLNYFVNQFLPFVIVGSLPGMRKEIRRWTENLRQRWRRCRRTRVISITPGHIFTVKNQPDADTAL